MTTPQEDYVPHFPPVLDNTMRSAFVACPQSFYQAHILKRAPAGGSVHLVAGAAYAKGLEVVRKLVWGKDKLPLDDALVEAFPAVIAEYGNFPCPEHSLHKSVDRVLQGLVAYFDRYPPASDHIEPYILKSGEPAVEFTFCFPLGIKHPDTGEPLQYAGRFDMVGVYNDLLWVVDDKTATQLGASWDAQWKLKAQLTGYTAAARNFGLPAEGAIVRGTSFLKSGAYGFSQPIMYRPQWMIERWWVQLHRDIARMIACWQDKDEENPYGYWDYNLNDTCSAFGGCAFENLCLAANPDEWAKTGFEFRDWNPLDLNPEKRLEEKQEMVVFSS